MRWFIGFAAGLTAIAAFLWISPLGWAPLAGNAPYTSNLMDDRFAAAAEDAGRALSQARVDIGAPAMSVAVGYQGQLVWAAVSGWADVENDLAASPETRFRIGSTSKSVTATGLARLVQQGIVDMDTSLETYMSVPNPEWASITPRQLASHMAGLPGYKENLGDLAGAFQSLCLCRQYDDVMDELDVFDGTSLLYEPGTAFHYSSFDVNLLSAVMQQATGTEFRELMSREVFTPLGMEDIGADHPDRDASRDAVFYERRGSLVRPWRDVDLSLKWAGGGFVSTSSDLVRLGLAWLDDSFIAPQTREMFWTPQQLADGNVNEQNYALGWRVGASTLIFADGHGVQIAHHGGVSKGSMSLLILLPEDDLVIALNINALADEFGDFSRVWPDIAQAFLE